MDRQNRTGQAELDRQIRTAMTGLPGKDCQDWVWQEWITRTGLPGQGCQDRTAMTRMIG